MEKLRDILTNIKDRFTNPLIFSFICSWLILNWEIVVALVWYDTNELHKTGFNTIYDFIAGKIDKNYSFYYPLYLALGYTFVMPLLKNVIRAFYTWVSKWGENWNLRILDGGKVPINKYLKFREDYDKRTKILENVISQENEMTEKYNEINTKLLETQSRENELKQEINEKNIRIKRLFDVNVLNGYWVNNFSDELNKDFKGKEEVFIQNGNYYGINKAGEKKHEFTIVSFYYDVSTQKVTFIKERVGQKESIIRYRDDFILRFNPNNLIFEHEGLLTGFENGTTRITYERKEPPSDNKLDQ